MGLIRELFGGLGTGLDHDWRECDRRRCAEPLCQVYWAGHADGNAAGYQAGYDQGSADGAQAGYQAGYAAGSHDNG